MPAAPAKKVLAKKVASAPAKKAPAKKIVAKKLVAKQPPHAPAAKKLAAKKVAAPAKKGPPTKKIAGKNAVAPAKKAPAKKATANGVAPLTEVLTKTALLGLLADQSGVELKSVKAVYAALENAFFGAAHKKGAREFVLAGILKVIVVDVPAKPKRFAKDPFTGEERWFPAKPATVRLKIRPLKKLKDAAL